MEYTQALALRGHESGIIDLARLDGSMPAWVERHILSQIGQPEVHRIWIDWRKGEWDRTRDMDLGSRLCGIDNG